MTTAERVSPQGLRQIFILGAIILGAGLFLVAVTTWGIAFQMSLCQGGESPQPDQGCSYLLYTNLFPVQGSGYPGYGLLELGVGSILILAGFLTLIVKEYLQGDYELAPKKG